MVVVAVPGGGVINFDQFFEILGRQGQKLKKQLGFYKSITNRMNLIKLSQNVLCGSLLNSFEQPGRNIEPSPQGGPPKMVNFRFLGMRNGYEPN